MTALADAIRNMMQDQEQYHYFSENSRNRVAQYFELERAMGAYRVIYSHLEGQAGQPAARDDRQLPLRPEIPQQRRRLLLRATGRTSVTTGSGA